ncbi:MAG: cobalt-zinc-cadmium efflux system outer membrane protein, partial [Arcobacteraceae bacterium]
MFKRTLLIAIGLVQIATAVSLENILKTIETNNHILKEKQTKTYSSKIDAALSNTWSNPVFGMGATDINLNEPTSRDIEAMQTQYISYSQVIPTNGKLKLSNDIKRYDINVNQLEYDNYKQKLKSQAISYSYTIIFQQEKVKILNKYLENLTQQKKLLNLLYENGKMDQSSLVNID